MIFRCCLRETLTLITKTGKILCIGRLIIAHKYSLARRRIQTFFRSLFFLHHQFQWKASIPFVNCEHGKCTKYYVFSQKSYHNRNKDAVFIAKETVNMRKMRCTSDKDAGTLHPHHTSQTNEVIILKNFPVSLCCAFSFVRWQGRRKKNMYRLWYWSAYYMLFIQHSFECRKKCGELCICIGDNTFNKNLLYFL